MKIHYIGIMVFSGLGFRPMPPDANVESTLIWFKASDEKNYRHWTDELDKFLEGNNMSVCNDLFT